MKFRYILFILILLLSGCRHPEIRTDGIKAMMIETREDQEFDFSGEVPISIVDWRIVLQEFRHCRFNAGKYFPKARLTIEYEDGTTCRICFLSSSGFLIVGAGDSPYVSKRDHPIIERYCWQSLSSQSQSPIDTDDVSL